MSAAPTELNDLAGDFGLGAQGGAEALVCTSYCSNFRSAAFTTCTSLALDIGVDHLAELVQVDQQLGPPK